MAILTQILAVTLKELRELAHRPVLVLTLIFGPLAIMIAFGIGSDLVYKPPRTIVVEPENSQGENLTRQYRPQFEQFLQVQEYTSNADHAGRELAQNRVDAVVILPPAPFETIARGQQAKVQVLYNEIDPTLSWLIPDYANSMEGEINRQIFLQAASAQRSALAGVTEQLDVASEALDAAIGAKQGGSREDLLENVRQAREASSRLNEGLDQLAPVAGAFLPTVETARERLQETSQQLEQAEGTLTSLGEAPLQGPLGITQARENLESLRRALSQFTAVRPEILVSPVDVESKFVAPLQPDVITFFAPAMMALLIQHTAVSLGSLSLVRERLAQTFDLYVVAPISNAQVLIGKYLANLFFTLTITAALVAALMLGFGVPLIGDPWRAAGTLVLMTLASSGIGFALSLIATSERQAVQFAMLFLLGIVFFSGFALPVESLRQPATSLAYAMPATYGSSLLQDIMLRGLAGNDLFLIVLGAASAALFVLCLVLLRWRTRPA
ncbi:MAG: ABC transporter permease [Chloroflexota bacterium]|nr:ABC transporter permease [Chloroflexota bacterium]